MSTAHGTGNLLWLTNGEELRAMNLITGKFEQKNVNSVVWYIDSATMTGCQEQDESSFPIFEFSSVLFIFCV